MNKAMHYLQWHIIHSCNLKCLHCYQEDYNAVMSIDKMLMALDKYERYLQLNNYEGQINLTGGEPLLHPEFFEIAGEIVNRGIRLGVLTNGTLIDEETAIKLSQLKPLFVQVSLDGSREVHDKIRGEGQFDNALKGIDQLKKQGIKVLVAFTAMKDNYHLLSELATVCKEHKVDKLWWDRVVTDDEALYLTTEEFARISKDAVRLKKKYSFVRNERALQGLPENICTYSCSAGKRLLIFLASGDMMACRRLPFVIGNIYDDMEIEYIIRNSDIMNQLLTPSFPAECQGCKHFACCRGGAKCVTYAQTGRLGIRDVNCYKN